MLGRPIATAPLATLPPEFVFGTQTATIRFASESFVTRATDNPPRTHISGRINNIREITRRLTEADDGQFGALIDAHINEVELNNQDGALDPLIRDYFADGREIRLYIGAKEIAAADRIMPQFIATGAGTASGNAAVPYSMSYPADVLPGDLLVMQVTINDRGQTDPVVPVQFGGETVAYGGEDVEY